MRPLLYRGPVEPRHHSGPFSTAELFRSQHRCAVGAPPVPFSFPHFFSTVFLCAVTERTRSVKRGESQPRHPCCPPLIALQTSIQRILNGGGSSRDLRINSQSRPDGLTDVIIGSIDGNVSVTLDPVCTLTLLYPQAK